MTITTKTEYDARNLFAFKLFRQMKNPLYHLGMLIEFLITTNYFFTQLDNKNDNRFSDTELLILMILMAVQPALYISSPQLLFEWLIHRPDNTDSGIIDRNILNCIVTDNDYYLATMFLDQIYANHKPRVSNRFLKTSATYEIEFLAKEVGAKKIIKLMEYLKRNGLPQLFEALYILNTNIILKNHNSKPIRTGLPIELIKHILSFVEISIIAAVRNGTTSFIQITGLEFQLRPLDTAEILTGYATYLKNKHTELAYEPAAKIEIDPENLEPIKFKIM